MRKRGKNVKQRDARSRGIKMGNLIGGTLGLDILRALDVGLFFQGSLRRRLLCNYI